MDREKLEQEWLERSEELQREEALQALWEERHQELERTREEGEKEQKAAHGRGFVESLGVVLFILGIVAFVTGRPLLGIGVGAVGVLLLSRALRA